MSAAILHAIPLSSQVINLCAALMLLLAFAMLSQRRVLTLIDPEAQGNAAGTTTNLTAALQILMPGESARPHRHSMNALRFVIDGTGASTKVDGRDCPMSEGDLRTCVSGMAGLGVAPHVSDKILNHQSGTISGVAAVYQRHQFLAERKEALERWGAHVERILSRVPRAQQSSIHRVA